MKKELFMMACLAVLGIQVVKAQIAALALHHKGNVTMYNATQFSNMMTEAEDGDTIYISTGTISTNITITKKLTFIGAGAETPSTINGDISLAIPDSVTLTGSLLKNLRITGKFSVDKPVAGMTIDKCRIDGNISFNANLDQSTIVSSYLGANFTLSDKIKNLSIFTSKLNNIYGRCTDPSNACFINCNICYLRNNSDANNCLASYVNCAIYDHISSDSYYNPLTNYVNCLFRYNSSSWNKCTISNCWSNGSFYINSGNLNVSGVDVNNYKGTDGTTVGVTGTSSPYTLTPQTPKVLTSELSVDEVGTTLSVKLTVGN